MYMHAQQLVIAVVVAALYLRGLLGHDTDSSASAVASA